MFCDACNKNCLCPRRRPDGEGKVTVGLTAAEIEMILKCEIDYDLSRRLEQALELLQR